MKSFNLLLASMLVWATVSVAQFPNYPDPEAVFGPGKLLVDTWTTDTGNLGVSYNSWVDYDEEFVPIGGGVGGLLSFNVAEAQAATRIQLLVRVTNSISPASAPNLGYLTNTLFEYECYSGTNSFQTNFWYPGFYRDSSNNLEVVNQSSRLYALTTLLTNTDYGTNIMAEPSVIGIMSYPRDQALPFLKISVVTTKTALASGPTAYTSDFSSNLVRRTTLVCKIWTMPLISLRASWFKESGIFVDPETGEEFPFENLGAFKLPIGGTGWETLNESNNTWEPVEPEAIASDVYYSQPQLPYQLVRWNITTNNIFRFFE